MISKNKSHSQSETIAQFEWALNAKNHFAIISVNVSTYRGWGGGTRLLSWPIGDNSEVNQSALIRSAHQHHQWSWKFQNFMLFLRTWVFRYSTQNLYFKTAILIHLSVTYRSTVRYRYFASKFRFVSCNTTAQAASPCDEFRGVPSDFGSNCRPVDS